MIQTETGQKRARVLASNKKSSIHLVTLELSECLQRGVQGSVQGIIPVGESYHVGAVDGGLDGWDIVDEPLRGGFVG